jgi:hypothetical protein
MCIQWPSFSAVHCVFHSRISRTQSHLMHFMIFYFAELLQIYIPVLADVHKSKTHVLRICNVHIVAKLLPSELPFNPRLLSHVISSMYLFAELSPLYISVSADVHKTKTHVLRICNMHVVAQLLG